jgi:serine/threonine protein kinase
MISECNRLEILKDVPNIPKLYTRGYDKYFHYSIMSKCPGGSLDSFLTNFKFTDQELKNVIRQILEIVKAIHDKGVVHGDLKTSNIMFNLKTRKISIIDFEKHKYSSDYRSPEHIMDCKTTVKNDCWAIGVIMYELFHEDICFDSKKEILKKEPEISDDMSELAKDLLVKLLDKDPNTRISIDEALNHSWFTQ